MKGSEKDRRAAVSGKGGRREGGPINESIKGDLERKSRTGTHFTCERERPMEAEKEMERERRLGAKKFKSCPELVRRVGVGFGMEGQEGRKGGRNHSARASGRASPITALAFTILYRKMAPASGCSVGGWMEH